MTSPLLLVGLRFSLLLGMVWGLVGCRELITFPVGGGKEQIVIEGYVTNETGPYWVRITRSLPYFGSNDFPSVDGAKVWIESTDGQVDTLFQADTYPGLYFTRRLIGRPNTGYHLTAVVGQDTFTARTWMASQAKLESISVRYDGEGTTAPTFEKGWYPIIAGRDPDTAGNYFRIRVFVNDSLFNGPLDYAIDKLVSDRFFVQGQIIAVEISNAPLQPGDRCVVELMNLNKDLFIFYQQVGSQLSAGSPFAPPGESTNSNIQGGALGYFAAYSSSRLEVNIPE